MSKTSLQIKTPKGFTVRVSENDTHHVMIKLYHSGKANRVRGFIGRVTLYKRSAGVYETHYYLDDNYHGKGLGALLYARAIKWGLENGHLIRSSGASSDKARRVWESKTLRKFFSIKKRNGSVRDLDVWYAYPKKKQRHGLRK